MDGAQDEEPSTPSQNIGITKESFMPQSAPQARAPLSGRRAKSIHQRIREQEEATARREAAEAAKKQTEFEAEERRLQEDIAVKRAESIKWMKEKEARKKEDQAAEATQKTGEKRKIRVDDLEVIPGPAGGGVGMNDTYFNTDENGYVYVDDNDVSMLDAFTPPAAKKVRFGDDVSPSKTNTPTTVAAASSQKSATPAVASQKAPTSTFSSQKASTPASATQKKPWWQSEAEFNAVSPHKLTPSTSMSDDPHRARPYTGRMFAEPGKENSFSGGNVFESQAKNSSAKQDLDDSFLSPITFGQKYGVWIGPKRTGPTPKGTFVVPDDSDSDEELDNESTSPTIAREKSSHATPTSNSRRSPEKAADTESEPRTNIFMKQSEATKANAENEDGEDETTFTQQPPPTPTPAHAALPNTPATSNSNGAEALAKARSQAEKYKPKTPSGLRAASRLSSSPVPPDMNDINKRNTVNIFGSPAPTFGSIDPALESHAATVQPAPSLFSAPNATPAGTIPASAPAPKPTFSFGQTTTPAAPKTTSAIPSQSAASQTATETYATGESKSIPYEQTNQYAIDLANAIPLEELGESDFVWPELPPRRPMSPGFAAYMAAEEASPDWEQSIEDMWTRTVNNYNEECAAGLHGPHPRLIAN